MGRSARGGQSQQVSIPIVCRRDDAPVTQDGGRWTIRKIVPELYGLQRVGDGHEAILAVVGISVGIALPLDGAWASSLIVLHVLRHDARQLDLYDLTQAVERSHALPSHRRDLRQGMRRTVKNVLVLPSVDGRDTGKRSHTERVLWIAQLDQTALRGDSGQPRGKLDAQARADRCLHAKPRVRPDGLGRYRSIRKGRGGHAGRRLG